jgi:hypothetical protein
LLAAIRNTGGTSGLKSVAATAITPAAAPSADDDPNDLMAAIRRAGNKDSLRKVVHEVVGRERAGMAAKSNLDANGNTLADALAQLRFQVADSDSDDDDDEISDDEWD